MNRRAAIPVVLLIVLIIFAIVVAGIGFYLFQKEHTKNLALQEQMDELSTRQRITEAKFEESKKVIGELQIKLQGATSQIEGLTNELALEKTANQEAQGKLEQITADLEQQKALRTDLEQKFNQAQEDAKKMQDALKDLEQQKNKLEKKVKELETKTEGVELGKIVVNSESAKAPEKDKKAKKEKVVKSKPAAQAQPEAAAAESPEGPEGRVLVVNKEYNFAVINLGSKDGVQMDSIFSVFRGDKYLGDLKVEKVHDSMAAAGFVSEDLKDKIAEGDKVLPKGK